LRSRVAEGSKPMADAGRKTNTRPLVEFWERVRNARDWTQAAFAQRAGIQPAEWNGVENGARRLTLDRDREILTRIPLVAHEIDEHDRLLAVAETPTDWVEATGLADMKSALERARELLRESDYTWESRAAILAFIQFAAKRRPTDRARGWYLLGNWERGHDLRTRIAGDLYDRALRELEGSEEVDSKLRDAILTSWADWARSTGSRAVAVALAKQALETTERWNTNIAYAYGVLGRCAIESVHCQPEDAESNLRESIKAIEEQIKAEPQVRHDRIRDYYAVWLWLARLQRSTLEGDSALRAEALRSITRLSEHWGPDKHGQMRDAENHLWCELFLAALRDDRPAIELVAAKARRHSISEIFVVAESGAAMSWTHPAPRPGRKAA
jgi:transcriptional regulator with XRE-family HTH domain